MNDLKLSVPLGGFVWESLFFNPQDLPPAPVLGSSRLTEECFRDLLKFKAGCEAYGFVAAIFGEDKNSPQDMTSQPCQILLLSFLEF